MANNSDNNTQRVWDLYRPPLAEFFATAMFVWCGCGSAVAAQSIQAFHPGIPIDNSFLVTVSLAFGLAIAVLVYTIAPISGGHINPAVTFAFVVSGKISVLTGIRYVLAQCLGALLGASIVWGCAASDVLTTGEDGESQPPFNVGMNTVQSLLPVGSAFLAEFMGTFLLVWTVIMTAVSAKSIAGNIAPIAIGWSVALAHFVLIPLTGCGINPARVFGPMMVVLIAGGKAGVEGWWVYYTAPFVGAGAAVLVSKYIFDAFEEVESAPAVETTTAAKESPTGVANDDA